MKITPNTFNGVPFNRKRRSEEEEEDIMQSGDKYLGYFTRVKTLTCITVPIDEGVREAVYYRQVAKAIAELGDQDQVEFEISSPGGYLDGLVSILTAMEKTNATTVAHINGECHSAASMLAMSCDVVYVSPYASMLVHFVNFGASGKGTDVLSKVLHVHETCVKAIQGYLSAFLTEDEIIDCINGNELWLTADDIKVRLERKFDALDKEAKKEAAKIAKANKPARKPTTSKVASKEESVE